MNQENIRNFLITAHIDHGKSTLADRLLEITGTVDKRHMRPQYLDQLELERERGITIKMAPVKMSYTLNSKLYTLNLIDTPGHSDFSYEVSRALAAVEGAVLLVDATQGIQAQTLANFENARKAGLAIIGAVNKIDAADADQILSSIKDLSELLQCRIEEILRVSARTGAGVGDLLAAVLKSVPAPKGFRQSEFGRALIFDSLFDEHRGIIAFVRVFDGTFRAGENAELLAKKAGFKIKEVGYFAPALSAGKELVSGDIGYVATGIKDPDKLKIGDTIISNYRLQNSAYSALPGYLEPKPVVFVSFYPADSNDYDNLRQSLGYLRLNDAALTFEPDMSEVLGRGFKGGFLGRLHFESPADRLARGEFSAKGGSASGGKVETVHSFPSVAYQIKIRGNGWINVTNPKDFPDDPAEVLEPMTVIEIVTPARFLSSILGLKDIFRFSGIEVKTSGSKTLIKAKLPLADLISDLDDKIKSVSEGFASLSYETIGWERAEVDKLEILLAGHPIPGLTRIIPSKFTDYEARKTAEKLKNLLPRQQFAQAIQAVVRGRVIARETIPAMRKDVTGYLYGGDRTRKMKLWKKQQRGKRRLKEFAETSQVKISAHIFKELLKK